MKDLIKQEDFEKWVTDNDFIQLPDGNWYKYRVNSTNSNEAVWTNTTEAMYEMYLGYLKFVIDNNGKI